MGKKSTASSEPKAASWGFWLGQIRAKSCLTLLIGLSLAATVLAVFTYHVETPTRGFSSSVGATTPPIGRRPLSFQEKMMAEPLKVFVVEEHHETLHVLFKEYFKGESSWGTSFEHADILSA